MADVPPPPPPPQPTPKQSGWKPISIVIASVAATVLVGLAVVAIVAAQQPASQPAAVAVAPTTVPAETTFPNEVSVTPSPPPEVNSKPKGTYTMKSCDLGSGNALVGSTQVVNTGDVKTTDEVTFAWQLGDGKWIDGGKKRVELDPGRKKLVFFSKKVGITTQLSFQQNPGYLKGKNCRTKATIVS
jgi:hypothetical protein